MCYSRTVIIRLHRVINIATRDVKSVRNFTITAVSSASYGFAYSPSSGWLSTFFGFYNGSNPIDVSPLIWNYNPSSGHEVIQTPSTFWDTDRFAYSSTLKAVPSFPSFSLALIFFFFLLATVCGNWRSWHKLWQHRHSYIYSA